MTAGQGGELDRKAAERLTAVPVSGETSVVDHVMNSAETHVSEQGTTLLADSTTKTDLPARGTATSSPEPALTAQGSRSPA